MAIYAVLLAISMVDAAWTQVDMPGYEDPELRSVMSWVRQRSFDRIPAIDQPRFVAADEVFFLNPGDGVIGVSEAGLAKAYPVRFLDGREIVNDSLGTAPITVTW